MDEFLTSMDEAHKSSTANPVLPLLTKWEGRFPGKTTDTVRTWGNVRDDRNLMIRRLEDTCQVSDTVTQPGSASRSNRSLTSNVFMYYAG